MTSKETIIRFIKEARKEGDYPSMMGHLIGALCTEYWIHSSELEEESNGEKDNNN